MPKDGLSILKLGSNLGSPRAAALSTPRRDTTPASRLVSSSSSPFSSGTAAAVATSAATAPSSATSPLMYHHQRRGSFLAPSAASSQSSASSSSPSSFHRQFKELEIYGSSQSSSQSSLSSPSPSPLGGSKPLPCLPSLLPPVPGAGGGFGSTRRGSGAFEREKRDAPSSSPPKPLQQLPLPPSNHPSQYNGGALRLLLKRQRTLDDSATLLLCRGHQAAKPKCEWAVPQWCKAGYPSAGALKHLATEVEKGLLCGQDLIMAELSCSGAYFCRNSLGRLIAVFKPQDEEPFAVNNPRADYRPPTPPLSSGLGGSPPLPQLSMKAGVPPGEAAVREVAAFVLDDGFAGVPATVLVKLRAPQRWGAGARAKVGSLQEYRRHVGCAEDFGCGRFHLEDAQRIALLDLRLLNSDRNGGNILVAPSGPDGSPLLFGVAADLLPVFSSSASALVPPSPLHKMALLSQAKKAAAAASFSSMEEDDDSDHGPPPYLDSPLGLRRTHSEEGSAMRPMKASRGSASASTSPYRSSHLMRQQAAAAARLAGGVVDGDQASLRLIPIDHGFGLPHPLLMDDVELCWLHWPQVKQGLTPELKGYVAALDVEEDIARVKASLGDWADDGEGLPPPCFLTLRIGTELLQQGLVLLESALTLHDLALLVVREVPDRPSALEQVVEETYQAFLSHLPPSSSSPSRQLLADEATHPLFMELFRPRLRALLHLTAERKVGMVRAESA